MNEIAQKKKFETPKSMSLERHVPSAQSAQLML